MIRQLIIVVVLLVLTTSYAYTLRFKRVESPVDVDLTAIPVSIDGFVSEEIEMNPKALELLGADETFYRAYRSSDGYPIWVFLGYFGSPQENSQIHSPKHCLPGSGWSIYDETSMNVSFAGEPINAKSLLITDGGLQQRVIYWFLTNTGVITNEYALRFDQMRNALLRQSQRATFIRFSMEIPSGDEKEAAERELAAFMEAISPHMLQALRMDAGGRASGDI